MGVARWLSPSMGYKVPTLSSRNSQNYPHIFMLRDVCIAVFYSNHLTQMSSFHGKQLIPILCHRSPLSAKHCSLIICFLRLDGPFYSYVAQPMGMKYKEIDNDRCHWEQDPSNTKTRQLDIWSRRPYFVGCT